ncbi:MULTISPECIES: DinB family protein [Halobacillus]|uniref:DinB family protein n=1 Tax=Halobacillus TaxID=45667 RepID=UPI001367EC75|nr:MULTISPECIES: DinB family protein [Halobacillus]MYL31505.1 DinB family protein [Halobacillus halophilus]MYL39189.1 DinB family protein [Halobacillus litoralis]
MNEEQVFQQIALVRKATLKMLDGITEEQADLQPKGFANNIRWNLGHIVAAQNGMVAKFAGTPVETPPRFFQLFAPGTKPADWEGNVPSLDELKKHLEEQPALLQEALTGKLDEEAAEEFLSMKTVGEILNFTLYHEGVHTGTIKAIKAQTDQK